MSWISKYHYGEYFCWDFNNPLKTYWKVRKYWKFPSIKVYFYNQYRNYYGKIFHIRLLDLQWKDKYNSPRHEEDPCIEVCLFNRLGFKLILTWTKTKTAADDIAYWESILDYLYYGYDSPIKAVDNNIWGRLDGDHTPVRKFLRDNIC